MSASAVLALLTLGIAAAAALGLRSAGSGQPWWSALALAAAAVQARPFWHWANRLQEIRSLRRQGHACFAIASDELLLVDAVGNAVVVALDRVTALEIDGDEARLRTDADEQGIIYAVMFQLFDESVPGPSGADFFEALAPRLRQGHPNARVTRREAGIGALTTRA